MNRYLVVSDLHLCDVEEHSDGWKLYKHSDFLFDDAFDGLVQRFCAEGESTDARTLVLNGDIIDFDLVVDCPSRPEWPVTREELRHGLAPTEPKSAWKMLRVLEDHPQFVQTLASFLAAGHTVVYIAGNHDPELAFPAVRTAFRKAVRNHADQHDLSFEDEQLRFERWFFHVDGEIYAEHGQQYDYYNSHRFVLSPVLRNVDPPRIALPMGNLANRRLMSQMGYFNPHAADFILNVYKYVAHWLRYYAFSRRSLVVPWFFGSFVVLYRLMRQRAAIHAYPPDHDALLVEQARRGGLAVGTVRAIDNLKRMPITFRVYRMVREFWIDRLILALMMASGSFALALLPIQLWIKLMVPLVAFPLVWMVYERLAHGETIYSHEREVHRVATEIARIVRTRVVTFGHTHQPELIPIGDGVVYANSGTWAPVMKNGTRDVLRDGLRNVVFVACDGPSCDVRLESCLPLSGASGKRRRRRPTLKTVPKPDSGRADGLRPDKGKADKGKAAWGTTAKIG